MSKPTQKSTALTVVPLRPNAPKRKKPSRRWQAYQQPRAGNGRFAPVPVAAPREPIDWNVLYAFRDDWRAYRQQAATAKHEARFGGLRSLAILTLLAAALVGMLIAGVAAQAG